MYQIAKVLLPVPVSVLYDYKVDSGMIVQAGDIVSVPFRSGEKYGVVWSLEQISAQRQTNFKLKSITTVHAPYFISRAMRQWIDWMAEYTFNNRGSFLKMILNTPDAFKKDIPRMGYHLSPKLDYQNLDQEIQRLQDPIFQQNHSIQEIVTKTGYSRYRVQKLIQEKILIAGPIQENSVEPSEINLTNAPTLSDHQTQALQQIDQITHQNKFDVIVIDGVTGSGKTEVYLEALIQALKRGQQVLILLPEIALSPQTIQRFQRRFGVDPAVWHSEISLSRRKKIWRDVCLNRIQVVAGARSALFLPFTNLGLIIVDEEHDQSYKQEESVIYQARDMAIVRAKIENIPILLVSATPSLETVVNCRLSKYHQIQLPSRFGQASMPNLHLIDCRQFHPDPPLKWLSPPLVEALEKNLQRQQQSLLFLNRRGYAPLTLCRKCGHRLQCIQCSAWLVEHKYFSELRCHHCGFAVAKPKSCSECHGVDSLTACGPGVERIYEEVCQRFKEARVLIMASDRVHGARQLRENMDKIKNHEIDIIVGTQMMAKGHHFELLSLVGVIDADLGLSGGDLRAFEKTYQLLHQVSGRAGRAAHPGEVFIQTYAPEHPVMQALVHQNRDAFIEEECNIRKRNAMPPYGRLVGLILSSADADQVEKSARMLVKEAPHVQNFEILGPVPAPLSQIRGRFRWRILLHCPKNFQPQRYLCEWFEKVHLSSAVDIQVDIDPYSFL